MGQAAPDGSFKATHSNVLWSWNDSSEVTTCCPIESSNYAPAFQNSGGSVLPLTESCAFFHTGEANTHETLSYNAFAVYIYIRVWIYYIYSNSYFSHQCLEVHNIYLSLLLVYANTLFLKKKILESQVQAQMSYTDQTAAVTFTGIICELIWVPNGSPKCGYECTWHKAFLQNKKRKVNNGAVWTFNGYQKWPLSVIHFNTKIIFLFFLRQMGQNISCVRACWCCRQPRLYSVSRVTWHFVPSLIMVSDESDCC